MKTQEVSEQAKLLREKILRDGGNLSDPLPLTYDEQKLVLELIDIVRSEENNRGKGES